MHPWVLYFAVGVPLLVAGYWLFRVFFVNGASCKSKARLDGKTVVITGANTGIGKETAIDLASRGGRIILGCRSVQRGEKACSEIREKSGSDNVVFRQLDLASCKSIRSFAERILSEEKQINILINNAGIMLVPYQLTEDGFESQFGINHLGHVLLTYLLLDRIKESAPSRIINVSSLGHQMGSLDFDDMLWKKRYRSGLAYTRSKLANVMFTRELADRLSGSDITVCSLHPGTIYTELVRHTFYWLPRPTGSFSKAQRFGLVPCSSNDFVKRKKTVLSLWQPYGSRTTASTGRRELRVKVTDQIAYYRPGVKEGVLLCESGASSTAFRKVGKGVTLDWAGKK